MWNNLHDSGNSGYSVGLSQGHGVYPYSLAYTHKFLPHSRFLGEVEAYDVGQILMQA